MGRNNKEVGAIPTWNWLTFMCCQPCLHNFQCFQSCVSWTLLHSLLLCLSCQSLRNVSFSGLILGLIKSAYHGCLSMMTSSEGPLLGLASGPPNPKTTTGTISWRPCAHLRPCIKQNALTARNGYFAFDTGRTERRVWIFRGSGVRRKFPRWGQSVGVAKGGQKGHAHPDF